jgi:4-amino-4-deoxy-L-arabinose transferase-like glycosyltransferase
MLSKPAPARTSPSPNRKTSLRQWFLLAAILALAAWLRTWDIGREGFANEYYAAAIRSMLQSPRLFFFAAFDPAGFVAVDKPPLGLWIQTAFALLFGFNGVSLILPQVLAGCSTAVALFFLVRRDFGTNAGLASALVLALMPVNAAADRNNTMDAQLMLILVLAAACLLRAVRDGRLRWLLISALLVGMGFEIKMLAAYLVLPAFGLVYFAGSSLPLPRRIGNLLLAGILGLAVSLAWPLAVDLTPPDARPYVGSSRNNSALELILGHNGIERVLPMIGRPPAATSVAAGQPGSPQQRLPGNPPQPDAPLCALSSGAGSNGDLPQFVTSIAQPPSSPQGQMRWICPPGYRLAPDPGRIPADGQSPANTPAPPAGSPQGTADAPLSEAGDTGVFRLFNRQLAGQASWLLAFVFFGGLAVLLRQRMRFPLAPVHQQLVLWSAWILAQAPVYSLGGIFHRYYLELLSPGIAALAGAGLSSLWIHFQTGGRRRFLLPLALLCSMVLESAILGIHFPDWFWRIVPFAAGVAGVAIAGLALPQRLVPRKTAAVLAAAGFLSQLAAPAVWSLFPALGTDDVRLPYAGPELLRQPAPPTLARTPVMEFLLREYRGEDFLVAAPNAFTAAPYILLTGMPAMAVGGFGGSDPILTVPELAAMVSAGRVRFFLVPEDGLGGFEMTQWLERNCRLVPADAYDGNPSHPAPGQEKLLLMDCRPSIVGPH